MSAPSTRDPKEIHTSQITRGLNCPSKLERAGCEQRGRAHRRCAPAKREDGEVPGQDRDAKDAKVAATRGCARLGDYSEPPPKRRRTTPVEIQ